MGTSVAIGPYRLRQAIGRGGMGVVFEAVHAEDGVQVAIKTLSALSPKTLAGFQREVRAVARLDHPGVVYVYDLAEVSARAAAAADGALEAGSPALVMEYCSRGSLLQCKIETWTSLRELLLAVLDALAHAHARGVIHRDLKPGNILRSNLREGVPGSWKIADFGIAHALGFEPGDGAAAAGTALYMAPEQVRSQWRDYGPWTDLYALGCVAWRLVTGRRLFEGLRGPQLLQAHLRRRPPRFVPQLAVPRGFEDWCRVLLSKSIRARYPSAADAAAVLMSLGTPEGDASPMGLGPISSVPTRFASPPRVPRRSSMQPGALLARPRMVIPETWEHDIPPPRPLGLLGAGRRLYGQRAIPLVGREPERDRLWAAIRDIQDDGPRAIVLRGPPGIGKTRLARWACERASEVGAARFLRVHCDRGEIDDQIRHALIRAMAVQDLTDTQLVSQVHLAMGRVAEPEPDLTRWTAGWLGETKELDTDVRRATMRRLLSFYAQDRPVIFWLDGADGQTRELAADLLAGTEGRVLFLITTRSGEVAGAEIIDLEPLDPGDHRALIRELLRLEDSLAARVEVLTEGNPQFAIELVGSWVRRKLLEPTPAGFALSTSDPSSFVLPQSMEGVWNERIDELRLDGAGRDALELAAGLGTVVEIGLWDGLAPGAPEVRERLYTSNLASPVGTTAMRFRARPFREAILARAAEGGRKPELHRRIARALEARGEPSVELGRHLVHAGEPERAWPIFDASLGSLVKRGGYRAALDAVADVRLCLDRMGVPELDKRRARLEVIRARMMSRSGAHHEARELAQRIEAIAREQGWTEVLVSCLKQLAAFALVQRDGVLGDAIVSEALGWCEPDDLASQLPLMMYRSIMARLRGEFEASKIWGLEAIAMAERHGSAGSIADAHKVMGLACLRAADHGGVVEHMGIALPMYREMGNAYGIGDCLNALSHGESHAKRYDEALDLLEQAAAAFEACGSAQVVYVILNIGLLNLTRERWTEARRSLFQARRRIELHKRHALLSLAEIGLAGATSALGEWDAFEEHLNAAEDGLYAYPLVEEEVGQVLSDAADRADRAGRWDLAARARDMRSLLSADGAG